MTTKDASRFGERPHEDLGWSAPPLQARCEKRRVHTTDLNPVSNWRTITTCNGDSKLTRLVNALRGFAPSAQHDKQDKPAGMCTTPYRESRRTAATLQTVRHSSFGGEGAPTRPSRLFTGKRGLGQKPERRTRINTKPPPPLPSFQHDILVPISFEGVSCWAGERKREEASTRALFPEKHARKPRVSRRRRRPYTFLNLSSAGCRYRKKASGCFVHSYPSCTRSIALKGRLHSRRFGVSPKNAEKEGSHLFHPTLAWVADCVF